MTIPMIKNMIILYTEAASWEWTARGKGLSFGNCCGTKQRIGQVRHVVEQFAPRFNIGNFGLKLESNKLATALLKMKTSVIVGGIYDY